MSKEIYTDKLGGIAIKYSNTYCKTIKWCLLMLNIIVLKVMIKILNFNLMIMSYKISKYENFFVKGYTLNWSEEVFVIENFENTVPWTYIISNSNGKEIVRTFHEQELQKPSPKLEKNFRDEKFIKKRDDKLYFKWKGYDISLNS